MAKTEYLKNIFLWYCKKNKKMKDIKIIVLTPIKNEDWILKQFLYATSLFADLIIVADQNSTDKSVEICKQFEKVIIIKNEREDYDEASRQKLLIDTARQLFPDDKRILFCLDADEIITSNSVIDVNFWNYIKELKEGTSLYFEKPEILLGSKQCIRWRKNYFLLGYVDDGFNHESEKIHSKRLPVNSSGQILKFDNVKFMHFAHSRIKTQSAKQRYYSVIENINNIHPVYIRRYAYQCNYDPQKIYPHNAIEQLPAEWLYKWQESKLELTTFHDPEYSWHDKEVIRFFQKYGYRRFYLDNIWQVNWEQLRQNMWLENDSYVPSKPIIYPSILYKIVGLAVDFFYSSYRLIKTQIVKFC